MIDWIAEQLEPYLSVSAERIAHSLRLMVVVLAAVLFVLITTATVGFDALFTQATIESLQVGSIAPQDFVAPQRAEYFSPVLTEERRAAAQQAVEPVYGVQDASIARQQLTLAQNILDFIQDIRQDPYGLPQQKVNDLGHIRNIPLDSEIAEHIVTLDDELWAQLEVEIVALVERIMRGQIRDNNSDLPTLISRLPGQVVAFEGKDADAVLAIASGLIRVNSFYDEEATEQQRQIAAAAIPEARIVFERGQLIVSAREPIDALAFEALTRFGLLGEPENRWRELGQAFMVSIIMLVVFGLYIARYRRELLTQNPRLLTLLALGFMLALIGARSLSVGDQAYLFPAAALALLFASIAGPEIAILATFALGLLTGLMDGGSLEIATYICAGGVIGVLTMRRPERLDNYFFAGLMVGLVNILVLVIFNIDTLATETQANLTLPLWGLLNGMLSATVAVAGLYVITLIFNLPTSLKLLALSQPNHQLLQRLLREAPGTYTHSLQVANLAEQAANAIGANANLVHVAALYHDIGKMLNPIFFVENQADVVNPHDALDDPYRSADIIMGHVSEGDKLARQYRIPNRIRDFIREHHGTTQVGYFYRQAVAQAGDPSGVDVQDFTYPGPKPQTRETAILMIADSCESATRARKPASREEVREIVHQIIDEKIRNGQLDDSGLTFSDIKVIQRILVDMLQAVFHPRINYPAALPITGDAVTPVKSLPVVREADKRLTADPAADTLSTAPIVNRSPETHPAKRAVKTLEVVPRVDDDDSPLPDVPPLPRITAEMKTVKPEANGVKTTAGDPAKTAPNGQPDAHPQLKPTEDS